MKTEDFAYDLPRSAIAQAAIEPRDAARVLRVEGMTDHRFREIGVLLREGDLVVVNTTRVRRARILGHRVDTGGAVEVLLLQPRGDGTWTCLLRPARRMRSGVQIRSNEILMTVMGEPDQGGSVVSIEATEAVEDAIERTGELPLPPYFSGTLDDLGRYQTMFADVVGSVAAPTAALHFTPWVVADLEARGVGFASIDLQIGLDTFRPMRTEDLSAHKIHAESFSISERSATQINATSAAGGRIIAVGTTVVRALETASKAGGDVRAGAGRSSLFIQPGYQMRTVDALITNFHAPRTSLVVLVASLVPEWLDVYQAALGRGYRFLSFGDAMFIESVGR